VTVSLGIAAFAIYFALAGWAELSYVDPTPAGAIMQIIGPFEKDGFAWRAGRQFPEPVGDFILYEDSQPLERRESFQDTIAVPGRFLHQGKNLLFSTRGDPNHNGKRYWAVKP
jgi:hypothetical protein